jgi:3',5'-cyclic AMP phosphodiesterase CpdA
MVASYLVVQISDLHLTVSGSLPSGVRPRDNLVSGLRLLEAAAIRPDVYLLTGDLTDTGDGACYDDLAGIVSEAARRSEARVIFLPGNHDDRDAFRRHLHPDGGSGPVNQTHWRDGLRIITLDSTVPGEDHGHLDDQSLGYLRSELATAAPDGTIVALHHPPIPSPIQPMTRIALHNPERLRDAISGSDVRIVVCGHNHHAALGMLGAVPVWVSPATAYLADTTSTQVFRGLPGAAFSRIDLTGSGTTVTMVPIPGAA